MLRTSCSKIIPQPEQRISGRVNNVAVRPGDADGLKFGEDFCSCGGCTGLSCAGPTSHAGCVCSGTPLPEQRLREFPNRRERYRLLMKSVYGEQHVIHAALRQTAGGFLPLRLLCAKEPLVMSCRWGPAARAASWITNTVSG